MVTTILACSSSSSSSTPTGADSCDVGLDNCNQAGPGITGNLIDPVKCNAPAYASSDGGADACRQWCADRVRSFNGTQAGDHAYCTADPKGGAGAFRCGCASGA